LILTHKTYNGETMFTTAELDSYVSQAAHDYLKGGIALNTSIEKIASQHGLNRDQISRVVEGANTEVYVQLFNQTTDKYVSFDNADAEKIASVIFSTEKTAEILGDDYEVAPAQEILQEKVATLEEVPLEKTPTELENELHKLAGVDDRLYDSLYEVDVRFQEREREMYSLVKQAVLSGTPFGDISKAVSVAYDSPIVVSVMSDVQEKLAEEIYPSKLALEATSHGSVNREHPILKIAGALISDANEFVVLQNKRVDVEIEVEKIASGVETKYLANVWRALQRGKAVALRKHAAVPAAPSVMSGVKKGLLIGGLGFAGGMGFKTHIDNVKTTQDNMPMGQIPPRYVR
jgi:hypothetical protein